jgi:hypothetical protein
MIFTRAFSCLQDYVAKLLTEESTSSAVGLESPHSVIGLGGQLADLEDDFSAEMQAYLALRRRKSTGTMSTMSIPAPPYVLEGEAISPDLYWK